MTPPEIKSDVPLPETASDIMRKMQVGQCCDFDFNHTTTAYVLAGKIGIGITAQKQTNGKLRVWRKV